ncbi:MAG TPA: hypothetical protein DDZ29_01155 [Alteromonas mediterranea]|nr:hypothetical protein [Alteromonas mediterranea]
MLFKPTLNFGSQTCRLTKEGAVSYFLGGSSDNPNDIGFKTAMTFFTFVYHSIICHRRVST